MWASTFIVNYYKTSRKHKEASFHIVQFQKIYILPPREGIGISWGVGGSVGPKNFN